MRAKILGLRSVTIGFIAVCLLMSASSLRAQGDCKAIEKVVLDASTKLYGTPAHVYVTSTISGKSFATEMIYAGGTVYIKINDKWMPFGTIKDFEKAQEDAKKNAVDTKATCHYVKDEPVNGEMAALYNTHSETPKGVIDLQIWISKSKGLPLRENTSTGVTVISARYEYGDIKPPL